jgi:hypothetical protein
MSNPAPAPTSRPLDLRPGPVQRASTSGLRVPTNKKTIYDRNLNRSRTAELSRASFAYLFGEMVSHAQKRAADIQDLESRYVQHRIGIYLHAKTDTFFDLPQWRPIAKQDL